MVSYASGSSVVKGMGIPAPVARRSGKIEAWYDRPNTRECQEMQSGLSSVGCGRDGNIGLSPFAVAEHNLIQPRHATDCYPLKAKRQAMRSRQKAGNGHL